MKKLKFGELSDLFKFIQQERCWKDSSSCLMDSLANSAAVLERFLPCHKDHGLSFSSGLWKTRVAVVCLRAVSSSSMMPGQRPRTSHTALPAGPLGFLSRNLDWWSPLKTKMGESHRFSKILPLAGFFSQNNVNQKMKINVKNAEIYKMLSSSVYIAQPKICLNSLTLKSI